jgi:hypothetical protein
MFLNMKLPKMKALMYCNGIYTVKAIQSILIVILRILEKSFQQNPIFNLRCITKPGTIFDTMKKTIIYLLAIAILPLTLSAQDTAVVKNQARVLAKAMLAGDYKTIIDHTYPKAVRLAVGEQKLLAKANTDMEKIKAQGVVFKHVTIGEPGKFYKAGTEIHCLVPETIVAKALNVRIAKHSYLLAISNNGCKTWTFLDLNNSTRDKIKLLIPNFNPELQLPESTTEQLQ